MVAAHEMPLDENAYGIDTVDGDTHTIMVAGPKGKLDEKPDPGNRPREFRAEKDSFDMMLTMKKRT